MLLPPYSPDLKLILFSAIKYYLREHDDSNDKPNPLDSLLFITFLWSNAMDAWILSSQWDLLKY